MWFLSFCFVLSILQHVFPSILICHNYFDQKATSFVCYPALVCFDWKKKKLLVLLPPPTCKLFLLWDTFSALPKLPINLKAQFHPPKQLANTIKGERPREKPKFYSMSQPFDTQDIVLSFQLRKWNTQRPQQCRSRLDPILWMVFQGQLVNDVPWK